MHLSMLNWMRAEPVEVTVRRLAKYGYESIELSGEPYIYNTKDVRKTLKEHGIRCWGAVTLMLKDRNLVARDEAQRALSVQYTKDCVTMVKELDGYELTIVPGTVGKIVADGTPEEEWDWAVDSMKHEPLADGVDVPGGDFHAGPGPTAQVGGRRRIYPGGFYSIDACPGNHEMIATNLPRGNGFRLLNVA